MLVNGAIYADGKRMQSLDLDQLPRQFAEAEQFLWIALKDPSADELERLKFHFNLHPLAIEDAANGHQRPKLEEYGSTLFSVIQLLHYRNAEIAVGEIDVFVNQHFILSLRSRSDQDFLGVRRRCEEEPHLLRLGPGYVFYAILDHVVDQYFEITEALQEELESIEESIFQQKNARFQISRLFHLKQQSTTVRHAALPLLEFIGKLHGGRVPPACYSVQEYFRDVHDHLARTVMNLESLRDGITTATQMNLSLVTIDETEVTKRLAAWAAIFAASTALAGIWGMNFEHMPELAWTYGYPACAQSSCPRCR
ncbi:MAG: magnesium and cobalt transport protein CorA, partial [Betaproteobacteria bacterium]|nr:magnesium and cobalt transport protein CorA [Betaproteobacteria bacterium]